MYAGGTFTMSGGLLSASSGTATTSSALSKAPTMTGVVSRTGSYSDKFAVYGSGTTYSSDNILTSTLDLSNNKTSSGWSNSTNSSGWKWDYAEAGSTLTLKNMSGGSITGNTAKDDAGGVYSAYIFTMTGGKISGNIANYNNDNNGGAGGVCNWGTFTMAEIGDVRRFTHKGALVAFAGVDAPPYQSGTFDSKSRHGGQLTGAVCRLSPLV